MHTYLPADLTINAYLRDYLRRLELDSDTDACRSRISNVVWVPLGASGRVLLNRHTNLMPEGLVKCSPKPLTAIYDRQSKQVHYSGFSDIAPDSPAIKQRLENREVIVLDSSVHSGTSMQTVCRLVQQCNPQLLSTYAFCLKRGANFIPNYFALLIQDWDRALFWLPKIPNNRLDTDIHGKNVQLRRIFGNEDFADLNRKIIAENGSDVFVSPRDSVPKTAYFNYVCSQKNLIYGILTFRWVNNENNTTTCRICRLRMVSGAENFGVVPLLWRWAETCARHNQCNFLELMCSNTAMQGKLLEMGFELDKNSGFLRRKIVYLTKTLTAFPDNDKI